MTLIVNHVQKHWWKLLLNPDLIHWLIVIQKYWLKYLRNLKSKHDQTCWLKLTSSYYQISWLKLIVNVP
ncbi:hypothetical protein [Lacticaseibacillus zeae]|uniref:hypothetical protein n=1 Tax=Lacticaseibacillus zeae TaxID=57037 RepID=UPI00201DAD21|nr:hypothetical protein [Lacticaseibacillus zeae]